MTRRRGRDPSGRWPALTPRKPRPRSCAALLDTDETVRQAAIHTSSVARDRAAVPELIKIVRRGTPQNRRAAAEALGRLDDRTAVPVLLEVAGEELDRTLEHSVTYALIELAAPQETAEGLASKNPRTRRAALLAMDQMSGGGLQPEAVAALVTSPDASAKDVAVSILERHSDWASALAPWLSRELMAGSLTGDNAELFANLLARYGGNEAIQKLVAARLTADGTSAAESPPPVAIDGPGRAEEAAGRVGLAGGTRARCGGRGRIAGGGRRGVRDAGRGGSSRRISRCADRGCGE